MAFKFPESLISNMVKLLSEKRNLFELQDLKDVLKLVTFEAHSKLETDT